MSLSDELMNVAPIHFSGVEEESEQQEIIEALMEVEDPEIGMDIINLGLVYEIHVDEEKRVRILMTLTAIGCPLAGTISEDVKKALMKLGRYSDVFVELVWNPPWDKERMSNMAKMMLGIR
ncbi:metal-sulfur cluster assembly factor [Thermicanus aegyptius]|uniref:metal-sulfur cluster assembly factor n=1 Tax=Thermicanus aegyptius TaxID=94009 RepID=UPI0003482D4C|nr:iron-sulfur cluster assembly protein [Thermicanus aegyptius]